MLGDEARLEQFPQPKRHVGVLGGVFRGALDGDAVEGDPGLARAGELVEVDRGVIEIALGERREAMVDAPGIEHVGHQHRIVDRRHFDAAQREDQPVEFLVMTDLEDAAIFQERLERSERCALLDLIGRDLVFK